MILVLDTDSVLYIFSSEDEVYRNLEALDIENQEYEFCDTTGRSFSAEVTDPVTALRGGAFRLIAGEADAALPMGLVDRAREIGRTAPGISSLADLRRYLGA